MSAGENLLEGTDSVLEGDELALITGKDLGDSERLRHETLDFTSTLDLRVYGTSEKMRANENNHVRSICLPPTTHPYPR
jgi:hypothetical protein